MKFFEFTEAELSAIVLSLKTAFLSSLAVLPIAVLFGWILARKNFAGKTALDAALHLPLAAPPVVTGFLLLILLGKKGLAGSFFSETLGIDIAFTFAAAVIAAIVVSAPLAIRTIKTSFELSDPGYEEAARMLGASRMGAFFRVALPLAMPGIISGFVLAFARSLGEFGATIIFADYSFGHILSHADAWQRRGNGQAGSGVARHIFCSHCRLGILPQEDWLRSKINRNREYRHRS